MPHQETLTEIPEDEVAEVVQDFKDSGATSVTKTEDEDGTWTVTATFPDPPASPKPSTDKPAAS